MLKVIKTMRQIISIQKKNKYKLNRTITKYSMKYLLKKNQFFNKNKIFNCLLNQKTCL